MKRLHIDIETYCRVPLAKHGLYSYAFDESFRVLLVAWAVDDEPTHITDITQGERLPDWFVPALMDPSVEKWAHNAAFERVCLSAHLWHDPTRYIDPASWHCTMIQAKRCCLPSSLKELGKTLGLEEQKMIEGAALIKLFCTPHEVSAGLFSEQTEQVSPAECPDDWETFKRYCIRDVDVEREIAKRLQWLEPGAFEDNLYAIDQRINDRGVRIDRALASNAQWIMSVLDARQTAAIMETSGLQSTTSVPAIKRWLSGRLGLPVSSLRKEDFKELKERAMEKQDATAHKVIELREAGGKSSIAKYPTMLNTMMADDRARGMIQFCGTRTGRWSGKFIQMQNLPQNHLTALDEARQMLERCDLDSIELVFGDAADTLSQLVRTALIPEEGKIFAVCDFSAIEARVLAWLAGEDWVLEAFRANKDIYCETASQMFHCIVEKHGRNAELRQRGKVAVLALGYEGGVKAIRRMGGEKLGMTDDEMRETVMSWRRANPKIAALWPKVEKAALHCITYQMPLQIKTPYTQLIFTPNNGKMDIMTIELPSGRLLCYPKAEIAMSKKGTRCLRYWSANPKTGLMEATDTYGGRLVENIVQGIARDCLAETMTKIESAGIPVVFHIHDELVMEVPDKSCLPVIVDIFAQSPEWAPDLPLKGASYTGHYYYKD